MEQVAIHHHPGRRTGVEEQLRRAAPEGRSCRGEAAPKGRSLGGGASDAECSGGSCDAGGRGLLRRATRDVPFGSSIWRVLLCNKKSTKTKCSQCSHKQASGVVVSAFIYSAQVAWPFCASGPTRQTKWCADRAGDLAFTRHVSIEIQKPE